MSTTDEDAVTYEFLWNQDVVRPGTEIRFFKDYSVYRFRRLTHRLENGETRVEYYCPVQDAVFSRPIESLRGVFKRKKSRRHKSNGN